LNDILIKIVPAKYLQIG